MLTTTALLVASLATAALSTGATLYAQDTQANQQEANMKYQADQTAADANAAQGAAMVEANRIRKSATMQRSQATAAAAASGVDVSSPTSVRLDQEITKNSEEDALLTSLNGGDRAARMRNQAAIDRSGAGMIRSNANGQMAGTLLSAVGNSANTYSNWKRAG
jgi:ribosomal protein L16 Arg81 hydroxylase